MSKFASLTAGLLARKGEAEPIATPFADQLLTRVGVPDAAADVRALTPMAHPHVHPHVEPGVAKKPPSAKSLEDSVTSIFGSFGKRGAHDAVLEFPRAPGVPAAPAHDDEEHADNLCGSCVGPVAEDAAKTYHVNLRMKRLRFVKLKLSAALMRKPVQDIVAEALDSWFDRLPIDVMGDCACLKARGE